MLNFEVISRYKTIKEKKSSQNKERKKITGNLILNYKNSACNPVTFCQRYYIKPTMSFYNNC